jgi:hypothetical protein
MPATSRDCESYCHDIQSGSAPADKEANLLPAGNSILCLPHKNEPSILDGFWVIPAVEKA